MPLAQDATSNTKHATPGPGWQIADPRPEPAVGQVWWDNDHRVTSRYARIVDVTDDGQYVMRRGVDGTGNKSTVSANGLRKRWKPLQRTA